MAKRREKGEGSIVTLSDGTYMARITINGKKVTRRAKTLKEAREKLKLLQKDLADASKRKTENFNNLTVPQYFNKYLKYKKKQLSLISYRRLETTVNVHISKHFEYILMSDLNNEIIEQRLNEAKESGLSHSTVKKIYEAFTGCFKYAVDIQKDIPFKENPMLGVHMIPEKNFKQKSSAKRILLNEGQNNERERFICEALRKYSNGKYVYRYGAVLVFILNTGIREGEMCGLFRHNIDLDKRLMLVCDTAETVKNEQNKYVTRIRKNETKYTSERYIPLNDRAIEMLDIINEIFPEKNILPLIYSVKNSILPPLELTKAFKRICHAAQINDIDGVGCHCLRHTFASSLFEQKVDIKIISELLGHNSTMVTENTYITVINKLKAEAINLPQI